MHGDGFPNHPVSWLLLRSPSPWHRRQLHHLFDGQQVRLAPRPRRRSHYAPIPADDRTFLADLPPLVWNQPRSFFRAQNKVYVVKLAGPEVAVGVAHRPSQVNRAASVLHGVIKKLHMSDAGCLLAIRGQPHRRFQPCRPPSAIEPQADHEQKLAFFQVLAILEMALDNPATHLRCHCDRFERGIPDDFVEIFRNILRGRLRHRDQWWRRGRSAACTSPRLHAAVINSAAAANTGGPARENGYSLTFL